MIQSIEIENFKSIRKQQIGLGNLNILIGPNGAGKSNFISLFRFLQHLSEQGLEDYVYQSGGIGTFLFKGFENSQFIRGKLVFMEKPDATELHMYDFGLVSDGESYQFHIEGASYSNYYDIENQSLQALPVYGRKESLLKETALNSPHERQKKTTEEVYNKLKEVKIYHFHDTSDNAPIKLPQDIEDVYHFKAGGENLAPFLLLLKEQHFETYLKIVEAVRLVYPFFHDFVLEESPRAKGKTVLRWKERGNGITYTARQVSDGTLRFICLATLLIQPTGTAYVPHTIILDEPELGLHPFAIHVLAELVQKAALEKQIIVATQSVGLINYFMPKDLLITERTAEGATEFRRLKDEDFEAWLEDYSLGQLWESNVFGGRP